MEHINTLFGQNVVLLVLGLVAYIYILVYIYIRVYIVTSKLERVN